MNSSKKFTLIFLIFIFFMILLRTAWIGDDAYITMRSIDNFVNGYGLTWNPGVRVQTYTHPLWMMLLASLYFLTHHAYGSLILLSIFFSLATITLFFHKVPDEFTIFIGWCMLILSNAFMDYSTSGLENPLSHFLILVFAILYLQKENEISSKWVLLITFVMGLLALNRMDLLLVVFPALIEIATQKTVRKRIWVIAIGFLPLILWEIFSVIYYGFPFPNTYYAKLHTGITSRALAKQGLLYFFNSIAWDPITLSIIGASLLISFRYGNKNQKVISLGILAYLAYIIKIGGDFMSGRFFSVPFILSVFILIQFLEKTNFRTKLVALFSVILLSTMANTPSFSPPLTRDDALENLTGISDEQAYYYPGTGLLRWGKDSELPIHQWANEGRQLSQSGEMVFVGKGIGFLGFNAGPNVHVIDHFALSDPLLAHLPVNSKKKFLVGHFRRLIPKGYLETLESGINQIEDPNVAAFYEKISLITRGNVWDNQRWKVLWEINTGQYDYLLE